MNAAQTLIGSSQKGFTLMELLVVSGLLVVLASLGLPAFQTARMAAWKTAAASNLRQLTEANIAYASDNGRYCPADNYWNNYRWCGGRISGKSYDPTKGYLADYLGKSRRVTPDPYFTTLRPVNSFELGSGGYGYNAYIGGSVPGNYDSSTQMVRIPYPLGRMAHPAETIMFGTSALAYGSSVQEYPYLEPPYWTDENGKPMQEYGRPTPSLHFRYNGEAIVSWCDGHVSFERNEKRSTGWNPYGGNADEENLGWFGPDENNGYWNPDKG
jgi:prepilin-type N-terminal cleavage/methylation domain-containing protein/prepilin-type processing-associated H-X9-DG protein